MITTDIQHRGSLVHSCFEAVSHREQLVWRAAAGMYRHLIGRQLEDGAALTSVDVRISEDIPEEDAIPLRILAADDDVHSVDHGWMSQPGALMCDDTGRW
ncbi:hypothetical protein J7E97_12305 [Streptomyces sp. ISL-66]|uniref:hypothetical protein n=1 Tax=Streptomyces sp. ISL-66 TaxID=2819186 RepID=UPI001BE5898D|nr:hypothetical protein [Streptomyces sp. ISL-66]MBT2468639.1 hypothetical protein [Streptomyces sp. ISL-66]